MPKADRATPTRFEGFVDRDARFFKALAKHQDREWFAAHREEYDEGWLTPMQALLTELREKLAEADQPHRPDHDGNWDAECVPCKANLWLETCAIGNCTMLLTALAEAETKLAEKDREIAELKDAVPCPHFYEDVCYAGSCVCEGKKRSLLTFQSSRAALASPTAQPDAETT